MLIVVSRNVMILFAVAVSWLLERPAAIRPAWKSESNTAAQIGLADFPSARTHLASSAAMADISRMGPWGDDRGSGRRLYRQWLEHLTQ
jgi:cardiolipin synthase (CMP-forming)